MKSRTFTAWLAAALLATTASAAAQSLSTVLVVDTTSSMGGIIPNLGATTTALDSQLRADGATSSYGLMGYNSQYNAQAGALAPSNNVVTFNGGLYGTSSQLSQSLGALTTTRGAPDPYQALQYAMTNAGYMSAAKPNSVRDVYLVTDSFREAQYTPLNAQGLRSLLAQNHVALTVLVQSPILAADGTPLAAVTRGRSGEMIGFTASSNCKQATFGKFAAAPATPAAPQTILSPANQAEINNDFIQVALDSGGVVADISQVGQGTGLACAMASATMFTLADNAGEVQRSALAQVTDEVLRAQVMSTMRGISNRVSEVAERVGEWRKLNEMNGASMPGKTSFWAQASNENLNATPDNGRFSGNMQTYKVGVDRIAFDDTILGVAIGLDQTDYNLNSAVGTFTGTSVSVTPYIALMLDEGLTWDAEVSAEHGNSKIATAAAGLASNGSVGSWTYIASTNLTATTFIQDIKVSGILGYAYGRMMLDRFSDSLGNRVGGTNSTLQVARVALNASYELTQRLEPYLGIEYDQDLSGKPADILPGNLQPGPGIGHLGLTYTGGLRYLLGGKMLLDLAGGAETLRKNANSYFIDGSLRVAF